MIGLSEKWAPALRSAAETGMGYQVASIILKEGTRYDQAIIDSGFITRIRGMKEIPFQEQDIAAIEITHDKWDFSERTPE